MGSIFKPSTTVVQAPQQSSTSYDIPEYFKEIQERTLRTAENVFSQPYTAYQGQRIAQLDPLETQAQNIYTNQIIPQSGQIANIANQTYDTATAQAYANPYENQVVSGALGDLQEAYGQSQKAMDASAIGSGAFGGERQGIENVLGQERYLDSVADTSARLRQAGFESGANRFMQDRQTQLTGATTQLGALQSGAQGVQALGQSARGIEQAGLAEGYRDFIEKREYPAGQIRQMIGALSGAPIRSYGEERSGSVGTPVAGPSIFGQVAGAGLAAYQMSDIRLKKDFKLVGKSPKGIKIYNFKYLGDDKTYQGVMAHQVPQASIANEFGYLMVDYSKLDVEFKEV
tara:strand:+ start:499 stop:1530 length:1032 start_codon:yes stop_codon:yes gene_type:complete